MEAVKTTIHDQEFPMHLWDKVARIVVYVQNRLSNNALGFKTPEGMYTGKKPEVIHLEMFGCPVYVHILKEKRTKLDPSGKKGIFVGVTMKSPNPSRYTFQYCIISILVGM